MEKNVNIKTKRHHKELFSIIRRNDLPRWKANLIRVAAILVSFLFAMALSSLIIKENFFSIIGTLFTGAFINPWKLFRDAAILLCFGIAILPPFKMKYWNMGSNGQVLFGAMMGVIIMFYLEKWGAQSKFNNFVLIMLMLVACVLSSIVFAVIPSIFKVFFKTNETLFTLMMNYIAAALVAVVNLTLAKGKQETPGVINRLTEVGWLPPVINQYFLPIVIIVILTVFIWFYMSKTKHGYEVTVVGDSINTAKYVGMNTKLIIIRTLILSGALCGVLGFLYASAINHCVSADTCGSLGFTGILVAWLSNFNPIVMALVSFFLAFLTAGTSKVSSVFRLGSNDLSNVLIGIIFFSILVSEFFIRYHIRVNFDFFNKKSRKEEEE